MTAAKRSVDFIGRLAEAWDGRGRHSFAPPNEHFALCGMAGLPRDVAGMRWSDLTPAERRALLVAARKAVELGRACAWCFGEGEGARS
jgi:hypothetical protein